jgi:hypothetical protein
MTQPLIDHVLHDARIIIADRRRRLRGAEAVTTEGGECDPCDDAAKRFCTIGALIRSAFELTGARTHIVSPVGLFVLLVLSVLLLLPSPG